MTAALGARCSLAMSLKICSFDMNVPLHTVPGRSLAEDEARWLDEEIHRGEVLTRCPPGPAVDLVRELRAILAARDPASLFVGANGALRHRAPGTLDLDWYGHWQLETGALLDLVQVRLPLCARGPTRCGADSARYSHSRSAAHRA